MAGNIISISVLALSDVLLCGSCERPDLMIAETREMGCTKREWTLRIADVSKTMKS